MRLTSPLTRFVPTLPSLALYLLVLCLLPLAGCGKKGDPRPPLRAIPAAAQDLQLRQQGWDFVLDFGYPKLTTSGAALTDLESIEVLQVVKPAPTQGFPATLDPREFAALATSRLLVRDAELAQATSGDRVFLQLPVPQPLEAMAYSFAVRTTTGAGEQSGLSNLVTLVPRTPPEPPAGIALVPGPEGIEITWTAPEVTAEGAGAPATTETAETAAPPEGEDTSAGTEGAEPAAGAAVAETPAAMAGFNVYRRDARSRIYRQALITAEAGSERAVDRSARFGGRYIYTVTTVSQRDPLIESRLSGEAEVAYQDRFPPAAPGGLVALAEVGQVRLRWDRSTSGDVTGYHVYRRRGSDFERLTREPLGRREYLDTDVTSGRAYTYRVTAVDALGNEGPAGDEVSTTVR